MDSDDQDGTRGDRGRSGGGVVVSTGGGVVFAVVFMDTF